MLATEPMGGTASPKTVAVRTKRGAMARVEGWQGRDLVQVRIIDAAGLRGLTVGQVFVFTPDVLTLIERVGT